MLQNIHKRQTQNFRRISPFSIAPVKKIILKKHIRLGHAGILDHPVDLSTPDFTGVYKKKIKGMDRGNKEFENFIKMHNSKYQCHMAACSHTTSQLTSPPC